MLLSISSSNKKNRSWVVTWMLTLAICIIGLTSYEFYLKQNGFIASIEGNKNLWSWYRRNIYSNKQIVIVGASRSQIDIDIPYLQHRYGDYNVTQLSINGQYPMATLKSLAEDDNYKGITIVSMNAQALETKYLDMQKDYNLYYQHDSTWYKSLDAYLVAYIQYHLRFLHPSLGLEKIVKHYWRHKKFPDVFYTSINLNQSITTDYSKTNISVLLNHFVTQKRDNYINDPPTKVQEWKKNIQILVKYANLIKKRGGRVILIRFPTDKGHWELDEKFYPRNDYWEKIAQEKELETIHFKDVAGMDKFNLPDSSHLDSSDTKKFTEILFKSIQIK